MGMLLTATVKAVAMRRIAMNAIKLFLAAFAALVCFPASAADSTTTTSQASTTTTSQAGIRIFSLHDAPEVAPNALSCRRAVLNPAAIEMFTGKGLGRFTPAVILDSDTCGSSSSGLVIRFYGVHEDPPDQITAGEGAYIFPGNLPTFQQALYNDLQDGW